MLLFLAHRDIVYYLLYHNSKLKVKGNI